MREQEVSRTEYHEPQVGKGDHDARVTSQPIHETATDPQEPSDNHSELMREYVADLLDRARAARRSEAPIPTSRLEIGEVENRPDRDCSQPGAPADLTSRPQPAESGNLCAMRELANSEARVAVNTHRYAQELVRARWTGALSLACLTGMLFVFYDPPTGPILGVVMLVGFIASIHQVRAALISAHACARTMRQNTTPDRSIGLAAPLPYFVRLEARMENRGFSNDGRLLQLVRKLHKAVHDVNLALHYLWCVRK